MGSRRDFLESLMLLTPGVMLPWNIKDRMGNPTQDSDRWGPLLPKRKLGSTGIEVSMLGVGGYHVGWTTEKDAQAVVEKAIQQGIRFFDSAYSYGDGQSERRYGKYLIPKYREDVFIMSKSTAPDYATARKELEESLRRYGVDQLDLWQIHSLRSPEDTDSRIQNGVLRLAEEALKEGKARYIGFTGHVSPYAHLRMIEQAGKSGLFSTLQMPINLVDAASEHSFVQLVIPKAVEAGLGLLAMKTLADGRFFGKKVMEEKTVWEAETPVIPTKFSVADAIHFSYSMPISTLITGAENVAFLDEKVTLAKSYLTLEDKDRSQIIESLIPDANEGKIEYYKTA
ncbi:MAG: aldo/keto reductase [Saprospiraceae bacterium]|nr:aldo/keto reductase [Saprospiraceae bacterium]